MFETVDPFQDFEEDKPVMDEGGEGVFIDDFLRNVGKADLDVFRSVEWGT